MEAKSTCTCSANVGTKNYTKSLEMYAVTPGEVAAVMIEHGIQKHNTPYHTVFMKAVSILVNAEFRQESEDVAPVFSGCYVELRWAPR